MNALEQWLAGLNWQNIINAGAQWLVKLLVALLLFYIGRRLIRWLIKLCDRGLENRGIEELLRGFLSRIISITLTVILVMMVLGQLGVNTTSVFALLGAAGLAVGLALKDSMGNFASGVMIILLKPFREGDYVEIAGQSGTVQTVNIFNTLLTTPDNREILLPNGDIMANAIVNYSANDMRRLDLVVGVDYKDDLKAARQAIETALKKHAELILEDPAPVIMLLELGESSVDFAVRPWCRTADYWSLRGPLLETIKTELEAAGCSIPFPQRDMHVYQYQVSETG